MAYSTQHSVVKGVDQDNKVLQAAKIGKDGPNFRIGELVKSCLQIPEDEHLRLLLTGAKKKNNNNKTLSIVP